MSGGPVFIVGCGRSGTTMLRLMLAAHPALAIPEESHFIYEIARRRATYRWPASLERDRDWSRLVTHLEGHHHLRAWGIPPESLRDRLAALGERSHAAAFEAVFRAYADREGKRRWGDKTPMHVQYMLILHHLFPGARFVHVIRDGRDVALSLLTRRWGPRVLALAGHYWKWLVLSGRVAGHVLGPGAYREIRFEELVTASEATLRALCDWLDLDYRDELMAYHETEAARSFASIGGVARRLAAPPDPERVGQWRSRMSARDQRRLLGQAGALLSACGYETAALGRRQERELERIRDLLRPETIARLDRESTPRATPSALLPARLLMDRLGGGVDFAAGRLEAWAASGLRWQRTVAEMLQ